MPKVSDYKITSYYTPREPTVEKFKIMLGGQVESIHKTYESAAELVSKLEADPWHSDRGYTKADRANW
jgi:hypothetical protein